MVLQPAKTVFFHNAVRNKKCHRETICTVSHFCSEIRFLVKAEEVGFMSASTLLYNDSEILEYRSRQDVEVFLKVSANKSDV